MYIIANKATFMATDTIKAIIKYNKKLINTTSLSDSKSHPNQHTKEEIKKVKDYKYKNKETGLVVLWVKLRRAGYTRSITGLYRVMQREGIYKKTPSKKKEYNNFLMKPLGWKSLNEKLKEYELKKGA